MEDVPDKVDYNFHVRPILSDKCFACHGPDANKREAGLRLDLAENALAELPENPGKFAIVARDPEESEFVRRIFSEDPTFQMPPPEAHLSLSPREKAILVRWIETGATYKPHWAFIAPKEPKVPKNAWGNNEIDAFIAKKRKEKGLAASPPASKETLIRRASFDLRGLPPSIEEIDAFLADDAPDAYERLVDRLLASPAYGERMAAHWLDVARYADSDGYLDDKHRDFSPWRDWVIQAFNQNMPYDEFVTWQLAGDLLPEATQTQVLATAFNRLHKKNSEAGIVFEEYRVEYVADRTNTFGKAFLGLSLECARCHDHKYDPISQEEYFELFGFFNSTHEIGHASYGPDQTPGPALMLTDEETEARIDFLQKKLHNLTSRQRINQSLPNQEQAFRAWLDQEALPAKAVEATLQGSLVAYHPFDRFDFADDNRATTPNLANPELPAQVFDPKIGPGIKGKAFYTTDYNRGKLGEKVGWFERTDPFTVDFWIYPDTLYKEAGIFTHCEELRLGYKGYSFHLQDNHLTFIMAHSWPQNAIQVRSPEALPQKTWTHVSLTYDGSSQAAGVSLYINGQAVPAQVDFDNLYKGILFVPDIHTYGFDGFLFGQRSKITPFKGGGIDELRIYRHALTPLEVGFVHDPASLSDIVAQPEQHREALFSYFLAHQEPQTQQLADSLKAVREQLNAAVNEVPEIMVMGDLPEPRPTYLLYRGNYDSPAQEVQPNTPERILPFDERFPPNRLGLAQWLFHPDHPLTARVIVNRIWQLHFGQGLVRTSEDFGNQGDLPTHPELLDWLAVWLQKNNWDLKALHKMILLSATYRQQSHINEEMHEIDPANHYFARGPRFRLPAEMVRDNALAISGLLVAQQGGASVYPYQPEGLWDELTNKHWRYRYLQTPGSGLYRRSIYTIWKRTSPPPAMQIFDIANRDVCTVRRRPTSTPLQALVMLNDPQFVEASRFLAARTLTECQSSPALDPLDRLFRRVTGRHPDPAEQQMLNDFFEQEYRHFRSHPDKAKAYLEVGESDHDPALPADTLAALAVVANSLLNTDEGIVKK